MTEKEGENVEWTVNVSEETPASTSSDRQEVEGSVINFKSMDLHSRREGTLPLNAQTAFFFSQYRTKVNCYA